MVVRSRPLPDRAPRERGDHGGRMGCRPVPGVGAGAAVLRASSPEHPPLSHGDVASAASRGLGSPSPRACCARNLYAQKECSETIGLHATPSGEYRDEPVRRGVDRCVAAEHRAVRRDPNANSGAAASSLGERTDTRGKRHWRARVAVGDRSGSAERPDGVDARSVRDCPRPPEQTRRAVDGPIPNDPRRAATHVADLVVGNAARLPDQPAIVDVTSADTLT